MDFNSKHITDKWKTVSWLEAGHILYNGTNISKGLNSDKAYMKDVFVKSPYKPSDALYEYKSTLFAYIMFGGHNIRPVRYVNEKCFPVIVAPYLDGTDFSNIQSDEGFYQYKKKAAIMAYGAAAMGHWDYSLDNIIYHDNGSSSDIYAIDIVYCKTRENVYATLDEISSSIDISKVTKKELRKSKCRWRKNLEKNSASICHNRAQKVLKRLDQLVP